MGEASKWSFVIVGALSLVIACGDEDGKKAGKNEKRDVKDPGSVDVGAAGTSSAVSGAPAAGEGGSQTGGTPGGGSAPRTAAGEGGIGDGGVGAGGTGGDDAGGAGGEAGTTSVPLMIGNPKNKTVLEGTDATFSIPSSGSGASYQWQQLIPGYQFGDIAGANSELLTLQAVPLSLDRASYRAIANRGSESVTSTSATLSVIPRNSGAYVALDSGAAHQQHTSMASWSTATYSGAADLQAGTLATSSVTPDNQGSSLSTFSVRLYNNSGSAITLPPGALQAHVDSSYVGTPDYYNTSSLMTTVVLSAAPSAAVDHGGSATLIHQVSLNWVDGQVVNAVHQVTPEKSPGTVIDILTDSTTELSADLIMPEITVSSGQTLWVFASLRSGSYGGSAYSLSPPMTVTMKLPPGVSFDSDAAVPLAWIAP